MGISVGARESAPTVLVDASDFTETVSKSAPEAAISCGCPPGHSLKAPPISWVRLLVIVALPLAALYVLQHRIDLRYSAGYVGIISLVTYVFYASDKRRAQQGYWRTPESTLHLFGLIGGWPGAFLAQHRFRHKTAKRSFQCVFWAIVLIHQVVAVDCLLRFRFSSSALRAIEGLWRPQSQPVDESPSERFRKMNDSSSPSIKGEFMRKNGKPIEWPNKR